MQNISDSSGDLDIISRVIKGDAEAFGTFIEKYKGFVLRIVKKHIPANEIEDVAQNAFLRIYQSFPMFKGKGSIFSWLSSITVRTCYDFWRKAYKSCEVPMNSLSENHQNWLENTISAQSEEKLREQGHKKEAAELLEWALCRLSPEDRMVIELVYLEGYSGKEAAKLLGWSVSNVKVRSFRLKKKLKSILKKANTDNIITGG